MAALLSQKVPRSPLPLMKDGDLLATIHSMLTLRGFDTVQVSKADAAADLERLRQQDAHHSRSS